MNYLRYSSDEMFSSTELIRKSKNIFDKLNKKQIEKAIILRDGKPGFMLLDFATYEKIMKEFEKLNAKASKKNDDSYLSLDDIEIETKEVPVQKSIKIEEQSAPIVTEEIIDTNIVSDRTSPEITKEEEKQLSEITQIEEMSSDEINDEELLQALAEIEKINIPDVEALNAQNNDTDEELEIDLEDLESIQEIEEQKPSQPLKEFWDK